jgi:hypothetical protein
MECVDYVITYVFLLRNPTKVDTMTTFLLFYLLCSFRAAT